MAKYLCYIQRKVDTDDVDHKFNSIRKANKNIWRPNLLAIIGRWIATTINLFHGSSHFSLARGTFCELSHPSFNKCLPLILLYIFEVAFFSKRHQMYHRCSSRHFALVSSAFYQIWPSYLWKAALQTYRSFNLLMTIFQV